MNTQLPQMHSSLGHAMSLGILAGTSECTHGKSMKNLDLEGSGLMDPSPGCIWVTPLKN